MAVSTSLCTPDQSLGRCSGSKVNNNYYNVYLLHLFKFLCDFKSSVSQISYYRPADTTTWRKNHAADKTVKTRRSVRYSYIQTTLLLNMTFYNRFTADGLKSIFVCNITSVTEVDILLLTSIPSRIELIYYLRCTLVICLCSVLCK
jgi:hypothetical protein